VIVRKGEGGRRSECGGVRHGLDGGLRHGAVSLNYLALSWVIEPGCPDNSFVLSICLFNATDEKKREGGREGGKRAAGGGGFGNNVQNGGSWAQSDDRRCTADMRAGLTPGSNGESEASL